MNITARIGGIEMELDDDQPGIMHAPEHVEDIAHRLGRQCVEVYNMLPESHVNEPNPADGD